jgi:dipeptidyl aminopeptidase/acylaminoacyl peptidase
MLHAAGAQSGDWEQLDWESSLWLSDDGAAAFRPGAFMEASAKRFSPHSGHVSTVERVDGSLLILRNLENDLLVSSDAGESIAGSPTPLGQSAHFSVSRYSSVDQGATRNRVLMLGLREERAAIFSSFDEGDSWDEGAFVSSTSTPDGSLATTPDGWISVLTSSEEGVIFSRLGVGFLDSQLACGGGCSFEPQTRVTVLESPSDVVCDSGGKRLRWGVDTSGDRMIDPLETLSSLVVCRSAEHQVEVRVREASDAECAMGKRIDWGLDTNDDARLSPSEVTHSARRCVGGTQDAQPSLLYSCVNRWPRWISQDGSRLGTLEVQSGSKHIGFFEINGSRRYLFEGRSTGVADSRYFLYSDWDEVSGAFVTYLVDAVNGNLRLLEDDIQAKVSTDGVLASSAFVSEAGYVLTLRSTPEATPVEVGWNLARGWSAFDWSPNGSELAFLASDDDPAAVRLYATSNHGESRRRFPGYRVAMFSWSPDGSKIAYVHHSTAIVASRTADSAIEAADLPEDGAGLMWLSDGSGFLWRNRTETRFVQADGSGAVTLGGYCAPAPDSSRVACLRGPALVTVRPDGTDLVEIVRLAPKESIGGIEWSPDSQSIAYTLDYIDVPYGDDPLVPFGAGTRAIYTATADGSLVRRLAREGTLYGLSQPLWAPDSSVLTFTKDTGGLFIMPPDGGSSVRVMEDECYATFGW